MAKTPPDVNALLRANLDENLAFLRRLRRHGLEQLRRIDTTSTKAQRPRPARHA